MSKNTRNRILLTALAALLLVTLTIGGTMAWLVDDTTAVTNVFTPAGIDIDLYETMHPTNSDNDTEAPTNFNNWSAQLVPGATYRKNPVVVVYEETDVPIYLFIKFEEDVNENVLEYDFLLDNEGSGWEQLEGQNVWWKEITPTGADIPVQLLANDQVKVKNVTKDDTDTGFQMTFTAYAIQSQNLTETDMAKVYTLAGGN